MPNEIEVIDPEVVDLSTDSSPQVEKVNLQLYPDFAIMSGERFLDFRADHVQDPQHTHIFTTLDAWYWVILGVIA